jgi:hypothetical protein
VTEGHNESTGRFLFSAGLGLLLLPTSVFVLASIYFIISPLGLSQTAASIILALAIVALILLLRVSAKHHFISCTLFIAALFIAAAFLSSQIIDTTIDGQGYHYTAMDSLSKGWNPVKQDFAVFGDRLDDSIWPQHYPKASWLFPAVQMAIGINGEWAKEQNITAMIAAFCLVMSLLMRLQLPACFAALGAVVIAGNPVVLVQLFTRMNDGLLYSSMVSFVALSLFMICHRERYAITGVAGALIFALNIKFSALPYLFCFCGFLWLISLKASRLSGSLRTAAILACITIIGVAVIGYSPYVKNVTDKGHLFYPIIGNPNVNILEGQRGPIMDTMSAPKRFLYSLLGETASGYESSLNMKFPFVTHASELRAAGGADTRITGFGPLFSGALFLGIATACPLFFGRKKQNTVAAIGLLILVIIVSVAICPENWWARYVPQLWLLPILIAIAAFIASGKHSKWLGIAITAVLILDMGIAFSSSVWLAYKRDALIRQQLHRLADSQENYCVVFDNAGARISLFRDAGVRFTKEKNGMVLNCPEVETIASYGADRVGGTICKCRL